MTEANKILLEQWNGFSFKLITSSDYPKVLAHLQSNFYKDEPIHKTLGVTPERSADMDQKISDIMDLNHGSFFAYPTNDPSKIAGVLLIWYHEKGVQLPPFEPRSPLTIIVRDAVMKLHGRYDIFEEHQVDVYPELFIISTDKEFRGKGLATEMFKKAINKMRREGEKLVASTFSNPLSRKIGERLGFKQVSRLDFKECLNHDGSSVFGEAGNDHFAVNTVLLL